MDNNKKVNEDEKDGRYPESTVVVGRTEKKIISPIHADVVPEEAPVIDKDQIVEKPVATEQESAAPTYDPFVVSPRVDTSRVYPSIQDSGPGRPTSSRVDSEEQGPIKAPIGIKVLAVIYIASAIYSVVVINLKIVSVVSVFKDIFYLIALVEFLLGVGLLELKETARKVVVFFTFLTLIITSLQLVSLISRQHSYTNAIASYSAVLDRSSAQDTNPATKASTESIKKEFKDLKKVLDRTVRFAYLHEIITLIIAVATLSYLTRTEIKKNFN
jgi:hypothetical protein